MADERNYEAPVETTDRGMFDFMKKKDGDGHKPSEADTVTSSMENVHVSEPVEEKKHGGLVEKFHRSHSSSSSSEKLGGHKDEHDHETNVPIEKIHVQDHVHSEPSYPAPEHHHQEEEKKGGFLDKIKDKLPGQHKDKAEEHEVVAPAEPSVEGDKDKKGFLDKIKDKIPGFHSKNGAEEKKDHEEKKEGY
uniref:Dehydrin n=1 Tax=Chenopodium quinoa TaxID=63459 RepID=A0A803LIN1_CHEQI